LNAFFEVKADALNKALELKLSVYDAAFLSLAEKLDARLLTLDQKLAKKLEQTKYHVLIDALARMLRIT
jgi:predicted nucleic acid-binding protein